MLMTALVLYAVDAFNYIGLWPVISLAKVDCFPVNYNSSGEMGSQIQRETITVIDRPCLLSSAAAVLDANALKTN
jgi:hypothetical protein